MATGGNLATIANLDTALSNIGTQWNELLIPAPLGIAVLSQLMICTSRVADFPIDHIKKEAIHLLIHPQSFRATLVQVVNESYNAFMKAHTNMEKIQLQVAQVPGYINECDKIIKSDNKAAKEKFMPRRLQFIKKAADDGMQLAAEVCKVFEQLWKLIQQVLLAIPASQRAKEKEMEDAIKAKQERQQEMIKKENEFLQKEVEYNHQLKEKGLEYKMEESKRPRGFLEGLFFPGEKDNTIRHLANTVEDADKRAEQAIQKANKNNEEMNKICDECTKSLEKMKVDIKDNKSQDNMINILRNGMKHLGDLQKSWMGMTLYFKSIKSYIEEVMKTQQDMFVGDAIEALKDISLIEFMAESLENSLKSSIMTQRTAATYVKVSNNYMLGPLRNMHGMLTIETAKVEKAQVELIELCIKASEGIRVMSNEYTANEIHEMQKKLLQ